MNPILNDAIEIARLTMLLGECHRATRHPSGQHESDTTHSMMLALVAARVATEENAERRDNPPYDVGLVMMFALVHDMVEAYAGDTATLKPLTPAERNDKQRREADALTRILQECPWLGRMVALYEAGASPEAQLVRILDKTMPRLTHALNGCRVPPELGVTTPSELRRLCVDQNYKEGDRRHAYATQLLVGAGELAVSSWGVPR